MLIVNVEEGRIWRCHGCVSREFETQSEERDPHARLRATRVARLEAQVRSAAPIGRVRAELGVSIVAHGIQVSVEVEARVHRELGDGQPAPRKVTAPRTKRGAHAS